MAYDEFFGCLLTSFGIPIVLVCFTILPHPLRIITLIISSSFWLVSLLFSSIIWFAVVPIRDKLAFGLVFSVIFQEIIRILFIFCLHKIGNAIKSIGSDLKSHESSVSQSIISSNDLATTSINVSDHRAIDDQLLWGDRQRIVQNTKDDIFNVTSFAYVGGLGFGLISGLFAILNMLVALKGPGTLGYYDEPMDFIDFYAIQTLVSILNHITFTVIVSVAFQAKSFIKIGVVIGLHMLSSCLTLLNNFPDPLPSVVLGINCSICFASCFWAFREADGQINRIFWAAKLNFSRLNRFLRHAMSSKSGNL